jgi:hypothetical protein
MRAAILLIHICAGTVGLCSGALAMIFRKGSFRHRWVGNVFFISMIVMSLAGAGLSAIKGEVINVLVGSLTFYLVITGWLTGRLRNMNTRKFDLACLVLGISLVTGFLYFGWRAFESTGVHEDPPSAFFQFGFVALLAVVGDTRILFFGALPANQRLARHLWRMCFSLFIAALSLFVGQSQVFPAVLRSSQVLVLPPLLSIILMIYWIIRVLRQRGRSSLNRRNEVLQNTDPMGSIARVHGNIKKH